jgi:hypothetical protein
MEIYKMKLKKGDSYEGEYYGLFLENENKIIRIWHPFIKGFFQKDLLNNKNIFDKTLAKEIEIL